QFREQLTEYEQQLNRLAEPVESQESAYAAVAGGLRVLDRASLALRKGLAGRARDGVLASGIAGFGSQGMALELDLLLRTGRARDVLEWAGPELSGGLGEGAYHFLRAHAATALGDYAIGEEEFAQLATRAQGTGPAPPRELMALSIGQAVLD